MGVVKVVTKKEKELLNIFSSKVKDVLNHEEVSHIKAAALSNNYPCQIYRLTKSSGMIDVLVKLMDSLGYEIKFEKVREADDFQENETANKLYNKFRKVDNDSKRRRTGKPILSQRELRELEQRKQGNFL